jgi:hypothetical protein
MGKLLQLRPSGHRQRERCRSGDLVVSHSTEIYSDADLRNLIDNWIVPKMIDDWFGGSESHLESTTEEDNGEQS